MTEDQKALKDIQGMGGFRVINSIIDKHIQKTDSVEDLDELIAAVHAVAKKMTVKALKALKSEINLSDTPERGKNQTYE